MADNNEIKFKVSVDSSKAEKDLKKFKKSMEEAFDEDRIGSSLDEMDSALKDTLSSMAKRLKKTKLTLNLDSTIKSINKLSKIWNSEAKKTVKVVSTFATIGKLCGQAYLSALKLSLFTLPKLFFSVAKGLGSVASRFLTIGKAFGTALASGVRIATNMMVGIGKLCANLIATGLKAGIFVIKTAAGFIVNVVKTTLTAGLAGIKGLGYIIAKGITTGLNLALKGVRTFADLVRRLVQDAVNIKGSITLDASNISTKNTGAYNSLSGSNTMRMVDTLLSAIQATLPKQIGAVFKTVTVGVSDSFTKLNNVVQLSAQGFTLFQKNSGSIMGLIGNLGSTIKPYISSALNLVGSYVKLQVSKMIAGLLGPVKDAVTNALSNALGSAFNAASVAIFEPLKQALSDLANRLKLTEAKFLELGNKLKASGEAMVENTKQFIASNETLSTMLSKSFEMLNTTLEQIRNKGLRGFLLGIKNTISKMAQIFKPWAGALVDCVKILNLFTPALKWCCNLVLKVVNAIGIVVKAITGLTYKITKPLMEALGSFASAVGRVGKSLWNVIKAPFVAFANWVRGNTGDNSSDPKVRAEKRKQEIEKNLSNTYYDERDKKELASRKKTLDNNTKTFGYAGSENELYESKKLDIANREAEKKMLQEELTDIESGDLEKWELNNRKREKQLELEKAKNRLKYNQNVSNYESGFKDSDVGLFSYGGYLSRRDKSAEAIPKNIARIERLTKELEEINKEIEALGKAANKTADSVSATTDSANTNGNKELSLEEQAAKLEKELESDIKSFAQKEMDDIDLSINADVDINLDEPESEINDVGSAFDKIRNKSKEFAQGAMSYLNSLNSENAEETIKELTDDFEQAKAEFGEQFNINLNVEDGDFNSALAGFKSRMKEMGSSMGGMLTNISKYSNMLAKIRDPRLTLRTEQAKTEAKNLTEHLNGVKNAYQKIKLSGEAFKGASTGAEKTKAAIETLKNSMSGLKEAFKAVRSYGKLTNLTKMIGDASADPIVKLKAKVQSLYKSMMDGAKNTATKGWQKIVAVFKKGASDCEKPVSNLKSIMSKLAGAFGLYQLSGLFKDSAVQAMKYEASLMTIQRTLGNASKSIIDFANSNAQAFGVSKSQVMEFGNIYSLIVGNFESDATKVADTTQKLIESAGIIAGATGYNVQDVLEGLRSGILGSSESVDQYGLSLKVAALEASESFRQIANGAESWNDLTTAQQQAIITQEILNQTMAKYGGVVQNTSSMHNAFMAQVSNTKLALGNLG